MVRNISLPASMSAADRVAAGKAWVISHTVRKENGTNAAPIPVQA